MRQHQESTWRGKIKKKYVHLSSIWLKYTYSFRMPIHFHVISSGIISIMRLHHANKGFYLTISCLFFCSISDDKAIFVSLFSFLTNLPPSLSLALLLPYSLVYQLLLLL